MGKKYLMALDAGSGSGRCIVASIDGEELHSEKINWSYFTPEGLSASACEFNPDEFWGILVDCIQSVLKRSGIDSKDIIGISSTSQREGIVLLDESGKELYAGPNRDFRAPMEGMTIANQFGDEIYQRSGHYPTGMFASARLLWFKKNLPDVYDKATTLLSINDWILFRLSGERKCEPTNACETTLFDMHTGEWMWDVIEKLELKNVFPEIVPAGTTIGEVSKQIAEETGLKAGTPVIMGGADTQCGLLGLGFISPLEMAAISGTTTPIQMICDSPILDEQQRTWTSSYLVPGTFVLESNAGGSGSVFQWIHDTFCEREIMESDEKDAFNLMCKLAESAPPGANGMSSYVGINIMNAKQMGAPPAVFNFGMATVAGNAGAAKANFLRAVLESLAFGVKANADQVTEISNLSPMRFGVGGGLSNSRLYNQLVSNVMQCQIAVPKWKESTGVGTAICAGVGAGVFKDFHEGIERMVKIDEYIDPDPALKNKYKSLYRRWLKSYKNLL